MILKKPYAILIKHFRLIHIILTVLMINVFMHSTRTYTFFNSYIRGETLIRGYEYTKDYFNIFLYFSLFVVILFSAIMLFLMKKKNKPYFVYVYYILLYSFVVGVVVFSFMNMSTLETMLLDVRVVRANRDFYTAAIVLQFIAIALTFVRGFGFDIKKFDFTSDLQGLEISEKDKEEIEVALSLDHIDPKAEVIKAYHNARYIFLENKFMYSLVIGVVLILVVGNFTLSKLVFDKPYSMNETIYTSMFGFRVNEAYITSRSFDNSRIKEGSKFIVLNMDVRDSTSSDRVLDSSVLKLESDGMTFSPSIQYGSNFIDLGNPYNRNQLTREFNDYLIVFEVFEDFNYSNARLLISDVEYQEGNVIQKEVPVDLNVSNIDEEIKRTNILLGEEFSFEYLGKEVKMSIEGAFGRSPYTNTYEYCLRADDCMEALEVIKLPVTRQLKDNLIILYFTPLNEHASNSLIRRVVSRNGFISSHNYEDGSILGYFNDIRPVQTRFPTPKNTLLFNLVDANLRSYELGITISLRNQVIIIEPEFSTGGGDL